VVGQLARVELPVDRRLVPLQRPLPDLLRVAVPDLAPRPVVQVRGPVPDPCLDLITRRASDRIARLVQDLVGDPVPHRMDLGIDLPVQ
jgi:hypothetical protein